MNALCVGNVRGTRVLFSEKVLKPRIDGLFRRKTELTNKVDKMSMGFTYLVDVRNDMRVRGIGSNRAKRNIFILATATC